MSNTRRWRAAEDAAALQRCTAEQRRTQRRVGSPRHAASFGVALRVCITPRVAARARSLSASSRALAQETPSGPSQAATRKFFPSAITSLYGVSAYWAGSAIAFFHRDLLVLYVNWCLLVFPICQTICIVTHKLGAPFLQSSSCEIRVPAPPAPHTPSRAFNKAMCYAPDAPRQSVCC